MKLNHNGKRYDTEKCEKIAEKTLRSHTNNYTGTRYIGVAKDGAILEWQNTNGQDCWISDTCGVIGREEAIERLDSMEMDAEQESAAVRLKFIKEI